VSDSHYFDAAPSVPSQRKQVALALPDLDAVLTTDRGVFSGDRIDPGTKYLLLEAPAPPAEGDLLDLGCGYGPIALTLAHRAPRARVWAVDVNERALDLVRGNAGALGADNVVAAEPDAVPDNVRFAAIYSNPPVRIGKAALHDLLRRWLSRLAPGGVAYLVVQKHLGSDSLARWMEGEGWAVRRLGSRMAYRLLEVQGAP
jgi:16S rRNA (guanine1207-N2)-methyltransferase